jgi:hypothetical protein
VNTQFSKVNGERSVLPGDIHQPVYNSGAGKEIGKVIADAAAYGVALAPDQPGTPIHMPAIKFDQRTAHLSDPKREMHAGDSPRP